MGGRPLLALNIVNWPVDDLPLEMLAQVLQGGVDVATAEGVAVAGGHSITDPEPKYGMVALGLVDPDDVVRNSTAPAGPGCSSRSRSASGSSRRRSSAVWRTTTSSRPPCD